MNFSAIDKMSHIRVINLLKDRKESSATKYLLLITRCILDTFLDKSISHEKRIYYMWYVVFFLRIWRWWIKAEIKKNKRYTLQKNWLTSNVYSCIELNADGILLLTEKCRENPETFLPWLCSSQPCEKFFRQTRSMTSTYNTIVNYDLLEIQQRKHRIQAVNDIISDSGKFCF